MQRNGSRGWVVTSLILWTLLFAGVSQTALAVEATRDLSGYAGLGVTFTVTIALDTPEGTEFIVVEDAPPTGWSASNISDGGTWDGQVEKIKWGPIVDPSIPTSLTYDLTPPGNTGGTHCFEAWAFFDDLEVPVTGDECIRVVPTVSGWGVLVMALLLLTGGTLLLARQRDSANGIRSGIRP